MMVKKNTKIIWHNKAMNLFYMNPIWHEGGYGKGQSWSRHLSHRRYAIIEMDNVEIPQADSHQDSLVLNNPPWSSFPLHTWLAPIKRAFHHHLMKTTSVRIRMQRENLLSISVLLLFIRATLAYMRESENPVKSFCSRCCDHLQWASPLPIIHLKLLKKKISS